MLYLDFVLALAQSQSVHGGLILDPPHLVEHPADVVVRDGEHLLALLAQFVQVRQRVDRLVQPPRTARRAG